MGAISAAFGSATLGRPQPFVDGFSTALKVNAGIAVLAAVVAALTMRSCRDENQRREFASHQRANFEQTYYQQANRPGSFLMPADPPDHNSKDHKHC